MHYSLSNLDSQDMKLVCSLWGLEVPITLILYFEAKKRIDLKVASMRMNELRKENM